MKVKEIENFVDAIAYESKDDNFFIEKKRQGFDMKLSLQEMFQKADVVCMNNNELLLEKYGDREILLTMTDPFSAMFGGVSIVISGESK